MRNPGFITPQVPARRDTTSRDRDRPRLWSLPRRAGVIPAKAGIHLVYVALCSTPPGCALGGGFGISPDQWILSIRFNSQAKGITITK